MTISITSWYLFSRFNSAYHWALFEVLKERG